MEEKKKYYQIIGRTTRGKLVRVSAAIGVEWVVSYFLRQYPNFKGMARLESTEREDNLGNAFFVTSVGWTVVRSFTSAKELKGE